MKNYQLELSFCLLLCAVNIQLCSMEEKQTSSSSDSFSDSDSDSDSKEYKFDESTKTHLCSWCAKQATYRCSACKTVYYCSEKHWYVDWYIGHNKMCSSEKQKLPKKELLDYLIRPLALCITPELNSAEFEKKKKKILKNRIKQTHRAYDCTNYANEPATGTYRYSFICRRPLPLYRKPDKREVVEDLESMSNKKLTKIKQYLDAFNKNEQKITLLFESKANLDSTKFPTIFLYGDNRKKIEHKEETEEIYAVQLIPEKFKINTKKLTLFPIRTYQVPVKEKVPFQFCPQGKLLFDTVSKKVYITTQNSTSCTHNYLQPLAEIHILHKPKPLNTNK